MTRTPNDFLWGAASSAHQIEGGNINADMWAAEHSPGSIFTEPSLDACDSYHRYEEDLSLLASAGLNAYRFSIEWARVEPVEGAFSRAALDHYRRIVLACVDRGLTPVVTLHHFTSPRWFAQRGGWAAPDAVGWFARYAGRVATHLEGLVPWVCTINEANVVSVIQASGVLPLGAGTDGPVLGDDEAPVAWVSPLVDTMASAHRAAFDAIKAVDAAPRVGWTLALQDLQAVEGGESRRDRLQRETQLDWLDVSSADDFVGVQTYTRMLIGPDGVVAAPRGQRMQTGWEIYPAALAATVRLAAERSRKPVLVTEHGCATDDDKLRIDFTDASLQELARCLDDGIDVRGYLHWTLLNNFEWMAGYAKTFGLVEVDRKTFERRPKPSLAWLGERAQSGRLATG